MFLFQRVLPDHKKRSLCRKQKQSPGRYNFLSGFTFVEILVVSLILLVVIVALLVTLSTGEFSNTVGSAKAELQSQVRNLMDWIVKDVRQTNLIQINTNNPTGSHIKFKQVTGIENLTGNYTLSTDYVEYTYDGVLGKITRSAVDDSGTVLRSWEFTGITQLPFYSAAGVPLAVNDILTSKKLVVIISGSKQVKGSIQVSFSLAEEVKIRNE